VLRGSDRHECGIARSAWPATRMMSHAWFVRRTDPLLSRPQDLAARRERVVDRLNYHPSPRPPLATAPTMA
jgi:hypothetical protein